VERRVVIDDSGNAVMIETERIGILVENEDETALAVQTNVKGVVLGNVLEQQQQRRPGQVRVNTATPAIEAATPDITQSSRDDADEDECCTCYCVVKWTLLTVLSVIFLPFVILYLIFFVGCCGDD